MPSLSHFFVLLIFLGFILTYLIVKYHFIEYLNFLPFTDLILFYCFITFFSFILIRVKLNDLLTKRLLLFNSALVILSLGYLTLNGTFDLFPPLNLFSIFVSFLILIFFFLNVKVGSLSRFFEMFLVFAGFLYLSYLTFGFMVLTDYSTYTNENFQNLSSVLLPIVNLVYGSYAPVDTQSFYGYYAYFFRPFFTFLDLNLTNVSLIFASVFFSCLLSMFAFIYHYSKYLSLSFIFLATSFFLVTSFANVWPGDLYIQYRPIRMLAPCLSLLIFIFYDIKPSYNRLLLSFLCLSILSVWNIDSGIPTILAFLVTILFISFSHNKGQPITTRIYSIFNITTLSILSFFSVWLIFIGYIYLKTGTVVTVYNLIEPFVVWRGSELFSLEFPQPVIITIFISSFYFLSSSYNIFFKINLHHSKAKLFVSLLIMGLVTYGSRNPQTAAICSYLIPVLLSLIFFEKSKIEFTWVNSLIILSVSILFGMLTYDIKSNPGINHVPTYFEINNPSQINHKGLWYEMDIKTGGTKIVKLSELALDRNILPPWKKKAKWIASVLDKNKIQDSDRVFIASEADHLLYMALKRSSPVNIVNWHHVSHFNRWDVLFTMIKNSSVKAIIIDETYFLRNADMSGGLNYDQFESLLEKNYTLLDSRDMGYAWYHPGWKPSYVQVWVKNYSNNSIGLN